MRTLKGQLNRSFARHSRHGSALILVVVLTVLLASLGVMFLMVARIGEMTTSSMDDTMALNTGVDVIVRRIEEVLIDDIVGTDGELLNGVGDSKVNDQINYPDIDYDYNNEYWDYPGDDDPWLASLEPTINDNGTAGTGDDYFAWPHITDLYDNNFGLTWGSVTIEFFDPDDASDTNQITNNSIGKRYLVSADDVPARILGSGERVSVFEKDVPSNSLTETFTGGRADADGDGVADSRWFVIPNTTSSKGEDIYAAVRIIDNSGMININTAYRDPASSSMTVTGQWDGSQLSHVNLEGIISQTDANPPNNLDVTDIQEVRLGNLYDGTDTPVSPLTEYLDLYDYASDQLYETDVAKQLLNPTPGYLPFDLSDELDLRNRYLLSSPVDTRCALAWPVTFRPGTSTVGKTFPYYPGDDLYPWFDKLKPDIDDGSGTGIGNYNRRFFSTTLNLDRTIAPWVGVNSVPPTVVMPPNLLAVWNNLNSWNDADPDNWTYKPVSVNNVADPNQLAAAIWLGLPVGSVIRTEMPQFAGLGWSDETTTDQIRQRAAYMMAVNLIDYVDADNIVTNLTVGNTTYCGHESAGDQLYISKIAVAIYNDATDTEFPQYAVELYNPGTSSVDTGNWTLDIAGTTYTLSGSVPAGSSYIIASLDDAAEGFDLSIGEFDYEDSLLSFAADDVIKLVYNIGTQSVFDIVTVPNPLPIYQNVGTVGLEKYVFDRNAIGNLIFSSTGGQPQMPIFQETLAAWVDAGTSITKFDPSSITKVSPPIQFNVADAELKTIGELTNVLALGMMGIDNNFDRNGDMVIDDRDDEHYNMPEFWEKIHAGGIDLTDVANIDAGRLDITDDRFANIFKYLTVFNPAGDGIDNDGVDSDNDWNPVDDKNELAIAGRININTAPWFVIKQLPWLSKEIDTTTDTNLLAQAIVAWRDKQDLTGLTPLAGPDYSLNRDVATGLLPSQISNDLGFRNIAELSQVIHTSGADEFSMQKHLDGSPLATAPDYTTDTIDDDLEERNILFQRISNLVTVRSDLFTAYILIRLDVDGPQRRMMAIFDRSMVFTSSDRPRLIALHPVPDPR